MDEKPGCGGSGPEDELLDRIVAGFLALVAFVGGAAALHKFLTDGVILFTLGDIAFPTALVAAAAAGAGIGLFIVYGCARDRLRERKGIDPACYAGVVNNIVESSFSGWNAVAPYCAQHDRVDVVVKPSYWSDVTAEPQEWIWCAGDSLDSPLIRSYFFSDDVRGAAIGSMIGAAIGAVLGFGLGLLVAAFCTFAFLVCLLAIFFVALAVTLFGGFAGGHIGRWIAGGESPMGVEEGSTASQEILVGHYVTFHANLALYSEDRNAWVAWWVDEEDKKPVLHGTSEHGEGMGGTAAPYNFTDPREWLEPDACHIITAEEEPPIVN